jgi:hypothetical protein
MAAALNLAVVDWNRSRKAELSEVSPTTTVGELLAELREAMHLSRETPYHLLFDGEKLHRSATLEESGVEDGAEVTIAPEVSAG